MYVVVEHYNDAYQQWVVHEGSCERYVADRYTTEQVAELNVRVIWLKEEED